MRPFITWTEEMNQELLRLHRTGLSLRAVAREMGLTLDQVSQRAYRIGLSRANPGQPDPKLAKQRIQIRKKREYRPQFERQDRKMRRCLGKCGKMFRSDWNGERVCPNCKATQEFKDGENGPFKVHLGGRV